MITIIFFMSRTEIQIMCQVKDKLNILLNMRQKLDLIL